MSVWYIWLFASIRLCGFWYGLLLYCLLVYTLQLLLKCFFGMEMMNGNDEFFFCDSQKNRGTIIAYHKYQKFKFESFRQAMLSRSL